MVKTFAVLAGAYKGKSAKTLHTHVAVLARGEDYPVGVTLCRRIPADHLADLGAADENEPASCPLCAKRDPRNSQDDNDGPFALKSIFQF